MLTVTYFCAECGRGGVGGGVEAWRVDAEVRRGDFRGGVVTRLRGRDRGKGKRQSPSSKLKGTGKRHEALLNG